MVEAEAISRLLKIADLVHTPVIIVHLSSGAGYQEVKYARERGQEVILETCPQYLILNESVYSLPILRQQICDCAYDQEGDGQHKTVERDQKRPYSDYFNRPLQLYHRPEGGGKETILRRSPAGCREWSRGRP